MKKFLLFAAACFFIVSFANAQIKKGSVLLGGGISGYKFKSQGSPESETKGLYFSPAIGIALKENSVLGIWTSYGHSKNSYTPTQEMNNYAAGLFYRKYLPLGKNFYLFGEAGASYTHGKNTNTAIDSKTVNKTTGFTLDLFPGVTYAVSNRFHLEVSLNDLAYISYGKTKFDSSYPGGTGHSETSSVDFGTSVSANTPLVIGFRFVLGK